MRKMIFALLFCFAAMCAHAQTPEKPKVTQENNHGFVFDYDAVREIVTREGAYENLLAKFLSRNEGSEFTYYDLALLYYGFAFQQRYKGSMDALMNPAVGLNKSRKYKKAWNEGIEYLKDNPMSLTGLQEVVKAGGNLEKSFEEILPYAHTFDALLEIISFSGNGKSPETAFKVISVADEYIFMTMFLEVYELKGMVTQDKKYDVFTIGGAKNFDGTEIYFDVSLPYEHGSKLLEK